VNKYFVGILNSWIVIPTEYTKINVQQIKMISRYVVNVSFLNIVIFLTHALEVLSCSASLVDYGVV